MATKRYRSDAIIQVEQKVQTATGAGNTTVEDLQSVEMLNTVAKNIANRALMQRVAEKLNLVKNNEFWDGKVEPGDTPEETVIAYLYKHSKASLIRLTRLIDVSFEHEDQELARRVCQSLVDEFIKLDLEQRLLGAGSNIKYLRDEAEKNEQKLRESEEKMQEYTKKLGSVSIDREMNIIRDQLLEINSKLTTAKAERLRFESDYAQIEAIGDDPEALLQIRSIKSVQNIESLATRLSIQETEIKKLEQRYKDNHPKMLEARSEARSLKDSLYAELLKTPHSVEVALRAAKQNEESLARERDLQERRVIEVKDASIQSKVLERQIEADRMAYETILQRLNSETSQARSQPVSIQVREPATPGRLIYPRPVIIMVAAVLLSLFLGVGTVVLIAYLDGSVRSVDEAEAAFQRPVFAAIPHYPRKRKARFSRRETEIPELPIHSDPHCAASEGVRTLRAAVALGGESGVAPRRVLVTSALPAEGKSFVGANLAVAYAQQGFRTLLVDADIRKPMVATRFGVSAKQLGLSEYLLGSAAFDTLVVPSSVDMLDLLVAGRDDRNPSELLSRTKRMEEFLTEAGRWYDQVIVDSAPVVAVSDTLGIARLFTTICLVVRAQRTSRRVIVRAINLLGRAGTLPCGIVLNNAPLSSASDRDYYSYGYGRSYKLAGSDKKEKAQGVKSSA